MSNEMTLMDEEIPSKASNTLSSSHLHLVAIAGTPFTTYTHYYRNYVTS